MPGDVGTASALKMAYAAWTKGSSALLVAVRALAIREGVDGALRAEWERSSRASRPARSRRSRANAQKAWRFVGEMEEIAADFAAAGLPAGFHEACAAVYDRLGRYKDAPATPSMTEVADALGRALGQDRLVGLPLAGRGGEPERALALDAHPEQVHVLVPLRPAEEREELLVEGAIRRLDVQADLSLGPEEPVAEVAEAREDELPRVELAVDRRGVDGGVRDRRLEVREPSGAATIDRSRTRRAPARRAPRWPSRPSPRWRASGRGGRPGAGEVLRHLLVVPARHGRRLVALEAEVADLSLGHQLEQRVEHAEAARSTGTATTRAGSRFTVAVSSGVSTVVSTTDRSRVASATRRRLTRWASCRNRSDGV